MQVKPFDIPGVKYAIVETVNPGECCAHCGHPVHVDDIVCISQEGNSVICWLCLRKTFRNLVKPELNTPRIIT